MVACMRAEGGVSIYMCEWEKVNDNIWRCVCNGDDRAVCD